MKGEIIMKFKLYWGGIFILAALLLIANQLGWIASTNLSFASIIIAVLIIPIIIASIPKGNFFGVFIPLAVLYVMFAGLLSLPIIPLWPLVIATALASIGFTILFHRDYPHWHKWEKFHNHKNSENFGNVINEPDSNNVNCFVKFGSSIKYVNSTALQTANLGCSFGALKVYFDNAIIEGDEATINIDVSFAGVEMYIPKTWKIEENVNVNFSGIEEKNSKSVKETTKTVHLTGYSKFSGIEIVYV